MFKKSYAILLSSLILATACNKSENSRDTSQPSLGSGPQVNELSGWSISPSEIKVGQPVELKVLNPSKSAVESESTFSAIVGGDKLTFTKINKKSFVVASAPGQFQIRAQFNNNKYVNGLLTVSGACPSDQHLENNSCVANIQSCDVLDPSGAKIGTGEKVYSDGTYGACDAKSCITDYRLSGSTCELYAVRDIYKVNLISNPNQVYNSEFTFTGYLFSFLFENQSYRTVNGIKTEDISILPPSTGEFVKAVDSIYPNAGQNQNCKMLTVIGPKQTCGVMIELKMNTPTVSPLIDETATFKAKFEQSNQEFPFSILFKRIYNLSSKTVIAQMYRQGTDYSKDEHYNGEDRKPIGDSLAKINLETGDYEYIAPCHIKEDGTKGSPRGVYPWYDSSSLGTVRTIGNKVFFSGYGCSHDGTRIKYEKWGMWEYDSDKPTGEGNPRRISRDFTNTETVWPWSEMPNSSMVTLNNKLYYISGTNTEPAVNPNNDLRRTVFEYDPSQPFVFGTNPKELTTGYELIPDAWHSLWPSQITTFDNKVYMTGVYYLSNPQGVWPIKLMGGVIEYDPSKSLSYGRTDLIESSDNPRFIWGFNDDDYPVWKMNLRHWDTFYVDSEIIALTGIAPANIESPQGQIADAAGGRELMIIRRSDDRIFKHDLCDGCDGDQTNFTKIGNSYGFTTAVKRADGSIDRTFAVIKRKIGILSGLPSFTEKVVFNTNPNGQDQAEDFWNFNIIEDGDFAYLPLLESDGTENLYKYDSVATTLTPVFTGGFKGTRYSFQRMKKMKNGHVLFRNERPNPSNPSANQASFNIFDPSSPQAGNQPTDLSANHFSKIRNSWPNDWAEDETNYLVFRGQSCPITGGYSWYLDTTLKNKDFFVQVFNNEKNNKSCNDSTRFVGERILIIK